MRSILLFACLCSYGVLLGQGSGFSFSYTGPTQILVGASCMAPLNWGHPNTPTATSNIPGGVIVSFDIYSISGGYDIGDQVMGGTTVTIFYQAIDNFGNNALFGFSIVFIDLMPPVFDPFSLPQNITISCTTNLPPPAVVEATDNCADEDPPLTITYTQTNNAQLCTGGTVQRRWVADDDLGNTSQFIQTITVTPDNTPPVIANNLVNGMAPCSTAMAQYSTWLNTQRANFSATDAGCGVMTLSDNAPSPAIITSFCGEVPVTFTAKDNCNNTSTVVKTFTVTNNVAPVIVTPANGANGNCSAPNIAQQFNTWISTHGGATATDDCSSIFWTTFPPSPSIADTCDAAIEVMFIAGDGCNNFDTTSASFILIDDTPPAITMQPSTMILGCTSASLDSILMDWLITGGHSAASDFCTPQNELELGYQINGNELTFQEVLDAWQDSLQSGCRDGVIINGIGINNVKALLEVRFTYDDNCDNQGGATGYFGITDNGRPVFDTLPSDLAFTCAEGVDWTLSFMEWYDSAGNADYSDACSEVTVHPSITADSAIAYLMAALDTACLQGVSVDIQFSLQDECGNISLVSPSATFSLGDTLAPVISTPANDLIINCASSTQMQLQNWLDNAGGAVATDGCGELTWSFSWEDMSGATQTGFPIVGPYPVVNVFSCNEEIAVIFIVEDICQNTALDDATFSFIDTTGPVINIAQDTFLLSCTDKFPPVQINVSDGCDTIPSINYQDSVGVDICAGRPSFLRRTFIVSDNCANLTTAHVWFLTSDTKSPTFDLPPDTVDFCSVDTLTLLNVSDNCDPSPVISYIDEVTGPACQQALNRLWIVTDACGNSASALQSFDLSDDAPPSIIYSPGHFVFTCDTTAEDIQSAYEQWMDSVVIVDACSQAAFFIAEPGSYILDDTTTWPGTPLPDSIMIMCGENMAIAGDLVVYDECGNAIAESISFTVNDTVGPSFVNCEDLVIATPDSTCTAIVTLTVPLYEEICFPANVNIRLVIDGGDTINVDTVLAIDTILSVGTHTALWIASDCNGNTETCETSILVVDENALTIFCPADTLIHTTSEICQTGLYIYAPQTTVGGCGLGAASWSGYVSGSATPDTFQFNGPLDSVFVDFMTGVHQVFLIATDSTGDSDTCFYTVEVRDTFPPEIHCQTDTIFLSPSGLDTIDLSSTSLLLSAADACEIDTVTYDPPGVSCSSNGQTIDVAIKVTDQNGNSSSCIASLVVLTAPLLPTWERGLCDDTLRLFSNLPQDTLAGYTYSWSGPNSFVSGEENPVIPGTDTSFSGMYTLTVQSANGCISTGSTDVLILELVSPTITAEDDTLCVGEQIVLNSQVFSGEVTYQWYEVLPSGDTLLGETFDPQLIIQTTEPGTFTYFAVIVSDTCMSEPGPSISLFVAAVPVASISAIQTVFCVTDSLFLIPENLDPNLIYSWSGSSGYASSDPLPPGIPANEIDSIGLYILTVSNAFCTSLPDSIIVDVQMSPVTPEITGDAQACEGGTIFLTASPAGDNFDWIDPAGIVVSSAEDTLLVTPVNMQHGGDWFVISYINGCPSDTSSAFTVQIDTAISIEVVTTPQVCEGDSITLTITPELSGDYIWSGPGGFISNETSPTVLAENGTYSGTVMTATGCNATDDVDVQVDVLPVILSLQTDADTCATGEGTVTIWAESQPGFNNGFVYQWSGPISFGVSDSSIILNNVTSIANGVYILNITNGACVSDTASIDLFLVDSPQEPVITGSNTYCFGDTIILSIDSPLPGGVYTWSSNDTTVSVASPGTLVLPGATLDQTGIYMVEVSVDGCVSSSASFAVQVRAQLNAPVVTGTSFVCEGDSLTLNANGPVGAIFTWSGPNGFTSNEEQPFIHPATTLNAGSYVVSYELNGCASPASASFEVIVQAALFTPSIISDITALCIDAPVPVTICAQPGTTTAGATYTWVLNGNILIGDTGLDSCITINGDPLQEGLNAITVITTLQGCPSDTSAAITIQGDGAPTINADAGTETVFCPDETIVLEGNDPSPGIGIWTSSDPLVIFADENNPSSELLPLPSGQYTLTWTLSSATCVDYSSDSITITVITIPVTVPDTVSVPFGQTGEFIVTLNDLFTMEPYTLEIVMNPSRGNALHAGNGVFRYTPNIGFVGTDVMIYRICSRDCPEECSEAVVMIQVGDESDCFVPSLFTPNDDGINDILIVPCLETSQFPQNKIIIFNEWGDAVYTRSPYLNDWDGTLSGNSLPVGTYFYIMDFGDGTTPKRSFLVLER